MILPWPIEIFALSFLAATIIPFSSEAAVAFAYSKGVNPYLLILVASLGNFLGGLTCYYLGKLGKLEWCEKYLKVKPQQIEKLKTRVDKFGAILGFFCWLPIVGEPIAVALGYFNCSLRKVYIYMFLGKLLRYIAIVLIFQRF